MGHKYEETYKCSYKRLTGIGNQISSLEHSIVLGVKVLHLDLLLRLEGTSLCNGRKQVAHVNLTVNLLRSTLLRRGLQRNPRINQGLLGDLCQGKTSLSNANLIVKHLKDQSLKVTMSKQKWTTRKGGKKRPSCPDRQSLSRTDQPTWGCSPSPQRFFQ